MKGKYKLQANYAKISVRSENGHTRLVWHYGTLLTDPVHRVYNMF